MRMMCVESKILDSTAQNCHWFIRTWTGCKEEVFYSKGGEALEQVAQRGGGCPIPGDVQGQAGWGSERPDWAVDVPVHHRELDKMALNGPLQLKWFWLCVSATTQLPIGVIPLLLILPWLGLFLVHTHAIWMLMCHFPAVRGSSCSAHMTAAHWYRITTALHPFLLSQKMQFADNTILSERQKTYFMLF